MGWRYPAAEQKENLSDEVNVGNNSEMPWTPKYPITLALCDHQLQKLLEYSTVSSLSFTFKCIMPPEMKTQGERGPLAKGNVLLRLSRAGLHMCQGLNRMHPVFPNTSAAGRHR